MQECKFKNQNCDERECTDCAYFAEIEASNQKMCENFEKKNVCRGFCLTCWNFKKTEEPQTLSHGETKTVRTRLEKYFSAIEKNNPRNTETILGCSFDLIQLYREIMGDILLPNVQALLLMSHIERVLEKKCNVSVSQLEEQLKKLGEPIAKIATI